MPGNGLTPPSRRIAAGELPGSESLRPKQNDQMISLTRQMGEAFTTLGEQMRKAPDMDTFVMTRASSILRQSQSALKSLGGQQSSPGTDLASSAGAPQRADGQADPMTGRSVGGQPPGGQPRI